MRGSKPEDVLLLINTNLRNLRSKGGNTVIIEFKMQVLCIPYYTTTLFAIFRYNFRPFHSTLACSLDLKTIINILYYYVKTISTNSYDCL